jgi:hypothetical protein
MPPIGRHPVARRTHTHRRRPVRPQRDRHPGAAATDLAALIAATAWPRWYSNSANVVVNDPAGLLAAGVSFDWTTFGLQISSTVAEFVPQLRLGWYGNGEGLRAYHMWLLVPREDSTYVVLEEIGLGDGAKRLARTNPGHMHRGHDLWNISLKFRCET